jgi:hypothetical protein
MLTERHWIPANLLSTERKQLEAERYKKLHELSFTAIRALRARERRERATS